MKKVKVIKDGFGKLKMGKEYELLGENGRFIVVLADNNVRTKFPKNIFEEVLEEKPVKKNKKKKKELVMEESLDQEVVEKKEELVEEISQPEEEEQGGFNEDNNAEEV